MLRANLEELEDFMRATYQKIRDLSQDALVMWAQPAIQFVLNMRSQELVAWKDLTDLTGEVMDEGVYMRQAIEENHLILIVLTWVYKAQLACLFGFWSLSESIYKDIRSMADVFQYSYGVFSCYIFGGISSYSLYKENGNRKHLYFARKNRKKLQRAESRGCPNVSAYLKLLDAEELSVRKLTAPRIVSVAYDRAIDAMAAAGRPHMEALANKRAAYFQVKQGNRAEAEKDFERAVHLYKYEWGGNAKHDWLTEESIAALSTIGDNKTGVVLGGVVGFGTDDWVDG